MRLVYLKTRIAAAKCPLLPEPGAFRRTRRRSLTTGSARSQRTGATSGDTVQCRNRIPLASTNPSRPSPRSPVRGIPSAAALMPQRGPSVPQKHPSAVKSRVRLSCAGANQHQSQARDQTRHPLSVNQRKRKDLGEKRIGSASCRASSPTARTASHANDTQGQWRGLATASRRAVASGLHSLDVCEEAIPRVL